MKKLGLLGLIGLVVMALMAASCGGPEEVPPEVPPPPVDTTPPPPPPDTTPPPPPPKPDLREAQFRTAYFDFDKYNLVDSAKAALDFNYRLLSEYEDAIIKIEGHCDERGSKEYNLALGEKRARSCQEYLVNRGIDPNRISIISYGEERPAATGSNERAWAKNRRCEFKIISQ